jgi:hypothetical protein
MTRMDIAAWLRGLALEQYLPAFRDNDIECRPRRRGSTRSPCQLVPQRRQITVIFCDLVGSKLPAGAEGLARWSASRSRVLPQSREKLRSGCDKPPVKALYQYVAARTALALQGGDRRG